MEKAIKPQIYDQSTCFKEAIAAVATLVSAMDSAAQREFLFLRNENTATFCYIRHKEQANNRTNCIRKL